MRRTPADDIAEITINALGSGSGSASSGQVLVLSLLSFGLGWVLGEFIMNNVKEPLNEAPPEPPPAEAEPARVFTIDQIRSVRSPGSVASALKE